MKVDSIATAIKLLQAFQNPEADPKDYQVRSYGYCTNCKRVGEYLEYSTPTLLADGSTHNARGHQGAYVTW